jgi:glutathione S-transferase
LFYLRQETGDNMITLYGFGQSRSFRALWALEESGLEYNYVPVDFGSEKGPLGSKSEEYKQINLQGKVPTLVDGNLTLTESAAMLNHIARKSSGAELIPTANTNELALYDEIMFFVLSDLEQPLWSNGKHRFALPEAQRIPQMLVTAEWEFNKSQEALAHHLDGREFVIGEHFTMADLVISHTINWAQRFEFSVDAQFLTYRDRHYQRAAAQRALEIVA